MDLSLSHPLPPCAAGIGLGTIDWQGGGETLAADAGFKLSAALMRHLELGIFCALEPQGEPSCPPVACW